MREHRCSCRPRVSRARPHRAHPDRPARRGVVHDPTAERMGGVAGHAGLFSTADDLARFCRMLLGGGALGGARVLVAAVRGPHDVAGHAAGRDRTCAASAGISTRRSRRIAAIFCRSGRSGTRASPARRSGSIRPRAPTSCFSRIACIPDGTGDVTPLRARIATTVAAGHDRRARADAARTPRGASSSPAPRRRCPPPRPRHRSRPASTCCAPKASRASRDCASACVTNHTGRGARRRPDDRSARRGARRDARRAVQPRTRHSRHPRRGGAVVDATRRPGCRFTRSTARRAGPTADMLDGPRRASSSICRTSARASTPT